MAVNRKISCDAEIELVVLNRNHRGIESVHKIENVSLIEHCRRTPNVSTPLEQRQIMLVLNAKLSRRRKDRTSCIDEAAVARNKSALWMVAYVANAGLESVGQQPIIGIEENEELTAAVPQPSVASGGKAGIFLVSIAHREIVPNDFGGIVG